jgi:hypothetical protein
MGFGRRQSAWCVGLIVLAGAGAAAAGPPCRNRPALNLSFSAAAIGNSNDVSGGGTVTVTQIGAPVAVHQNWTMAAPPAVAVSSIVGDGRVGGPGGAGPTGASASGSGSLIGVTTGGTSVGGVANGAGAAVTGNTLTGANAGGATASATTSALNGATSTLSSGLGLGATLNGAVTATNHLIGAPASNPSSALDLCAACVGGLTGGVGVSP